MAIETEEDFINLVKKAEQNAKTHPRAYTTRLALFAILGYVVIILILVTLLGLFGGLLAVAIFSNSLLLLLLKKKLIFAAVISMWILLRALWVKFIPPQGYIMKRKEFPELFAELDALSKQLKSLKIDEVILDKSLNAAVVQHPRLGLLGWHKNYLILGYQLMLTLSPEEMRSVLAHEFGHLSGNHSRFNGWIYRVRSTWMMIMNAFDNAENWGGKLMSKFFNWYSPQFDAYSFALARHNEFEADAVAAELTSPEIASRALINIYALAPYLQQNYWDDYFNNADEYEKPPYAPFEGLTVFLKEKPLAKEEMLNRIDNAMEEETHYSDTHPSLKERVEALGVASQTPVSPATSAAEAWLGESSHKVMEDLDHEWLSDHNESWKQRYEYVTNAKNRLQDFAVSQVSELNDEELWNYAYWTDEFHTSEAALPLFRAYQERYPDDPDPAFFIGITLLNQGDESGLDQLRLAMKNADLLVRAAHAGYNFLKQQNQEEEAEVWWQEAVEQNEVFIAANKERESFTIHDNMIYPQIDDDLLQQLIENLKKLKNVGKVWLAQKNVQHFPESPVYIISFTLSGFPFSSDNINTKVANDLNIEGNFFVVSKTGDTKVLAKKVIKTGKRII